MRSPRIASGARRGSAEPARDNDDAGRTPAPEHRIRDVLDQLALELDVFERAGRLRQAMAGASWKALQMISRVAGTLVTREGRPAKISTCLHHAAEREIARRPRYQIRERLGVGGMAEVFRGWQIGEVGFERQVAIKRLLPRLARSDRHAWLISHEADVLARMPHPNVVHVIDVVLDDDDQPLLVLEYVDGIDLGKLISGGPLPISVIVFIVAEILNGLGFVHHLPARIDRVLGVVHRDLSPDNILLSWDGAVKISDFGIAKRRSTTEVSVTPCVQGKPGYMSPEQHRGDSIDGRSDLYSVGIILWELLANRRLFPRTVEDSERFDREVPRPGVDRHVPRGLEAVAMKLLRPNRNRRYRTAEAAYDAIARCDAASWLRGRAELVELLGERFPEQAAHRPVHRPPLPHTPTSSVPPPPGASREPRWERWCWWMRERQWERQRRRARRLSRGRSPAIAVAVAFVVVALWLAVWAVMH